MPNSTDASGSWRGNFEDQQKTDHKKTKQLWDRPRVPVGRGQCDKPPCPSSPERTGLRRPAVSHTRHSPRPRAIAPYISQVPRRRVMLEQELLLLLLSAVLLSLTVLLVLAVLLELVLVELVLVELVLVIVRSGDDARMFGRKTRSRVAEWTFGLDGGKYSVIRKVQCDNTYDRDSQSQVLSHSVLSVSHDCERLGIEPGRPRPVFAVERHLPHAYLLIPLRG